MTRIDQAPKTIVPAVRRPQAEAAPGFEPGAWKRSLRQHPEDPALKRKPKLWRDAPLTLCLVGVMTLIEAALLLWPDAALPVAGQSLRAVVFSYGAFQPQAFLAWLAGEGGVGAALTLITHQFLHGGLLHLGFNMAALLALGFQVEKSAGARRFLALFLLTGVAGALAQLGWELGAVEIVGSAWALHISLVGASGAIFGLLGALIVQQARALARVAPERRKMSPGAYLRMSSVGVVAINLLLELSGGFIAGAAHLGGFALGLALSPLFLRDPGEPPAQALKTAEEAAAGASAGEAPAEPASGERETEPRR